VVVELFGAKQCATAFSPGASSRLASISQVRIRSIERSHYPSQNCLHRGPSHFNFCKASATLTRRYSKDSGSNEDSSTKNEILSTVLTSPTRSFLFSVLMTLAGALLGPFLDSYHSAFGVLQYEQPLTAALWASSEHPALITAWWVPELFGIAGFLIGWLYILLDVALPDEEGTSRRCTPSPPKILVGISLFTLQYWLSGLLFHSNIDRTSILNIMSVAAAVGFGLLDGSFAGLLVSSATAVGGPLIEAGLLSLSRAGAFGGTGYQYLDPGETGFFPLWIVPVYFLGGPAVGNLARGVWNGLSSSLEIDNLQGDLETSSKNSRAPPGCTSCQDTRRVSCPNCDGVGQYVATGGRSVDCTSCRGRGFVMCRACFSHYDEDPNDIDEIREVMSRMPD
jgi:hypothetical protein